jgi:hypothetical protein
MPVTGRKHSVAKPQNLESFNDELNTKLKAAMERYIDTMHGTGATIAQSTEVVRAAVDSVNLEADSESKIVLVLEHNKLPGIGCAHVPNRIGII